MTKINWRGFVGGLLLGAVVAYGFFAITCEAVFYQEVTSATRFGGYIQIFYTRNPLQVFSQRRLDLYINEDTWDDWCGTTWTNEED